MTGRSRIRETQPRIPDVGPLLVGAYRCMSELRRLREVADALPTIEG